jgi:crossover junction endodeoxyribonuclease RusA
VTTPITFAVLGTPRPQGSKRYVGNGRFIEASDVKPWRAAIAAAAEKAMEQANLPAFDGPVVVSVVFFMPRPRSVKRQWPEVAPDTDKLQRAVGDGLSVDTKAVLTDDSKIVKWESAVKVYADSRQPGAWISIRPATEQDLRDAISAAEVPTPENLQYLEVTEPL